MSELDEHLIKVVKKDTLMFTNELFQKRQIFYFQPSKTRQQNKCTALTNKQQTTYGTVQRTINVLKPHNLVKNFSKRQLTTDEE